MRSDPVLGREAEHVRVIARLGVVCAAAVTLGGCAHGSRERYFESRGAVVPFHAGDGSARVAMWPSTGAMNAALAAAENGRASDFTGTE